MQDNYEHYITRNIKSLYRRRLIAPTVYLIFITFLWVFLPVFSVLFPTEMEDMDSMQAMYDRKEYYVETELKNLNFTGYTKTRYGRTTGYFYYCKYEDRGYVVLLNPSTCEQGLPEIKKLTLRGKIMKKDKNYDALLDRLSGVPKEKRTARFVCAVAAVFPDGETVVKRGTIEGYIGDKPAGENGFGYDPIFYVDEYNCSTAELSMEQKNAMSHRGNALRAIKGELEKRI